MGSPLHSLDKLSEPVLDMINNDYSSFTSTPSVDSDAPPDLVVSANSHQPFGQAAVEHKTTSVPCSVIGQFSFAPATQTTVVTTTTTTTTSFPPLMMKDPHHLHELDSKLYPLAALPTPQSIKRFCIDVGGRPTIFREADDATVTLGNVRPQFLKFL